jgi:hypothetical protein
MEVCQSIESCIEIANTDVLSGNVFPGATLPFGKHL